MAKSMRCKRVKRLRAIRREIVEPHYDKKDAAKFAALEAALAAPKLPVRPSPFTSSMDVSAPTTSTANASSMDVDIGGGVQSESLKPVGGIGKKSKRKFKVGKKGKRHGKGKFKKGRHI